MVHAERRRGRSRTRVLYWFRTPPGVKVGRVALDDEALRRIEAQNPDLEFDWPKILKGGGAPPTEARPPFEVRRQRPAGRPRSPEPSASRDVRSPAPVEPPPATAEPPANAERGQPAEPSPMVEVEADEPAQIPADLPAEGTPAHEKIGQEGVQRLRQRYADIRARILGTADPARRDALMATAQQINPDGWTTADEVASGLEQYESVLASLREVAGRKRRRRKRGGGGRRPEGPAAAAAEPGAPAADTGEFAAESHGSSASDDQEPGTDDEPGDFGSGSV